MNNLLHGFIVYCADGESRFINYDGGKDGTLPKTEVIEAEPALKALRLAREGLLAAAAYIDPRSPAFKEVKSALKSINETLGISTPQK